MVLQRQVQISILLQYPNRETIRSEILRKEDFFVIYKFHFAKNVFHIMAAL